MIERFVKVVGTAAIMFLAAAAHGQQAEPQQAQPQAQPQQAPETPKPAATQDSSQETVEVSSSRRVKPRDYKPWEFSVSGGGNLPHGTTNIFVKGGSAAADAGVARNFSKYVGFRLDFSWTNLPLRVSALELAQSKGGSNQIYGLSLDPIFYIPVTRIYSGYALVGPGFYRRSGKLDSSTALPGASCNAFWNWWGTCFNGSIPLGTFLKENQNQVGFNYGGGVARKATRNIDLYAEYRAMHSSLNKNTTDARTLTVGVRW